MENSMEGPQKTKNQFHNAAIPLLDTYLPKNDLKKYMHTNVPISTNYNSQNMEATYMSINRRMDKEDTEHTHTHTHTHTHRDMMDYYSAIKRMKFCHLQQCGWT